MIKEVFGKLKLDKLTFAPHYLWESYSQLEKVKSKQPIDELTALISLIRYVCGIDNELRAFDQTIKDNFNKWIFKQHTRNHNCFSSVQID